MNRLTFFAAFAVTGLWAGSARADWTSYRGPLQNGVSSEKLATPTSELRQLWKTNVGIGTSSVVVSGEHAFTMGNVRNKDVVYCFDAASGREVWKYEYRLASDPRMFEGGPAATPTLDGNRVYTVSHQGDLFCLDAATGKPLWYKHYQQDFRGKRPQWGFAGSPLVEGSLLIVDVGARGASTIALDKTSGKIVWKSGDDDAGYASPIAADIAGKRTIVMFKATALVGLDAASGRELWRQAWKTSYDVNAATPLVVGNRIFVSSGYGHGCGLFEVTGSGVSERWQNKNLKAHINTPVIWQGSIYGSDGDASSKSPLVCLDLETGKVKWEEKIGGGSLVVADGKLVILSELGELIIGDATPNGFKPALRQQVLGKRCWVQPTFANGRIFCRNNNGDVAVLAL
jgi:outer membrane protein assembly factor BamB